MSKVNVSPLFETVNRGTYPSDAKIGLLIGKFMPCEYGIAPGRKLIGVPSPRYVAKSPPSAPETEALPKVIVEVVNWSDPDAEKYPEIVEACAAATPNASAEKTRMDFSNRSPGPEGIRTSDAAFCTFDVWK